MWVGDIVMQEIKNKSNLLETIENDDEENSKKINFEKINCRNRDKIYQMNEKDKKKYYDSLNIKKAQLNSIFIAWIDYLKINPNLHNTRSRNDGFHNIHSRNTDLSIILSSHPTKSIDYFLEKDFEVFYKNYFKQKYNKEATENDLTQMIDFIKAKVKLILSMCYIPEDLTNCYFYDIIYNKIGIEGFNEKVKILTFNYDLLLEQTIDFINKKEPNREVKKEIITHIYGNIQEGIKFMDGRNGKDEKNTKEDYKKKINEATHIYFLGFGFDDLNIERLGLAEIDFKGSGKQIFICNYGGNSRINALIYKTFKRKVKDFTLVKEGARVCMEDGFDIYISEKDIETSLKDEFHFAKIY